MPRYLAVVDTDRKTIFVEYPECIVEYHLGRYAAALENSKYFDDAELRTLNHIKIPELVVDN